MRRMEPGTNTTMRRVRRKAQRGFTLIEIMVVIVILGLIIGAVGVAVIPKLGQAKTDRARLDIKQIENALKLYYVKKGNYPDTATGLKALVDTKNLDKLPMDPWGKEYVYLLESGKPVVISYGRDGTPSGDDEDMDVSSKDADVKAQ